MSNMTAVLAYAAAIAIPLFILYLCRPVAWYWHLLAVLTAVCVGMFPPPAGFEGQVYDLILGCVLVALVFWGLGGLLMHRTHRERHA